ncbi:hypothetical protein JCM3765_004089 [Sporobolomyces pararoseus]
MVLRQSDSAAENQTEILPTFTRFSLSPNHFDLTGSNRAPSFDLLVLGCGGGPIETNLSCYLVKAKQTSWKKGCAALEGGSTIGAIASLVEKYPESFEGFELEIGVDENELSTKEGFVGVGRDGGGKCAGKIWELIKSFSITHAHLDHIAGLVISSAAVQLAAKNVYGLPSTIKNLESVMDFGVWPNLGTRDSEGSMRGKAYVWREIDCSESTTAESRYALAESLTSTAIQISHGTDPAHSTANSKESYVSTAFFIRNEQTQAEFLFYGDVEPDSISCDPRTRKVWESAARKIVDSKLNVIFLECSYPSSQPKDKLFGHLSPPFVIEELEVLAHLVQEERERRNFKRAETPLEGIYVVIQHIKDDIFTPEPPSASPTTAKSATKPLPLELITTKDADSTKSPLSPLSMSPPIATIPLRRSSVQLSQFSFPSTSSLNSPHSSPALSTRRASLYPPPSSYFSPANASPSRKSSTSSSLAPVLDEEKEMGRRNSTPGGFRFGTNPSSTPSTASPGASSDNRTDVVGVATHSEDKVTPAELEEEEEELVEETVHERIERELNELEEQEKLGVRFVIARQGMRLIF